MPNAPCSEVSRLTVSRLPCGRVFGYPCVAASAAAYGRLPEWPKGAVCKTVGSAYVGSNPTPATTSGNGPLAANSRAGGPFLLGPSVCHLVTLWTVMLRCPRTYSGRACVLQGRSVCTVATVGVHSCDGRATPSVFHGRPRTSRADAVSGARQREKPDQRAVLERRLRSAEAEASRLRRELAGLGPGAGEGRRP